jgi:hypothetical protein
VRVDGKLRASVAGEAFDLPVSNAEPGFYGFVIEDPGYAAIRSLYITSPTAH